MAYAELEISLHRRGADVFAVEMRFNQGGSDADVRLLEDGSAIVRFNFDELRAHAPDPVSYGELLTKTILGVPEIKEAFGKATSSAQTRNVPLRLRLLIGPGAPDLHDLHWETLRDIHDNSSFLTTSERLLFSRYLSSLDMRPVRPRPLVDLRALVVIANPVNLTEYRPADRQLAPVDVAGELARAKTALGSIVVTSLASGGLATLNNLADRLRDGCDILYLVCHGGLTPAGPVLWWEDEGGRAQVVEGSKLVDLLADLQEPPALVVLASCQSAGRGVDVYSNDQGALVSLGPRLAEAGIPAVVAMQGNVSMQTIEKFMPFFFRELERDGQIDRAMAAARRAVQDRPDLWVSVLFMSLRSGRIWYAPGFADEKQGFEKWPALLRSIHSRVCTPILGSGLLEFLLGSPREIARRWADKYRFPMAPHDREDLPQVAQYLAINQSRWAFPREELEEYLRREMLRRYYAIIPEDSRSAPADTLARVVGANRRELDPTDPHRILAQLPFPIYITTNPDSLLADALIEAGKAPSVEICRWNQDSQKIPSVYDKEPGYRPDEQHPLVFHLFGHADYPESIVLTEDDYFDFLIGFTKNKKLIPSPVLSALTKTSLLFLGFQLDDWNFRVLFRNIMNQEGSRARDKYGPHVGVQLNPEEGRIIDSNRAQRYLESYFLAASISIYWGNVEHFVKQLWQRWAAEFGAGKIA